MVLCGRLLGGSPWVGFEVSCLRLRDQGSPTPAPQCSGPCNGLSALSIPRRSRSRRGRAWLSLAFDRSAASRGIPCELQETFDQAVLRLAPTASFLLALVFALKGTSIG